MVDAVGQNISEQATGGKGTCDIPSKIMTIGMIPLGKTRGIFNFNRMTKVDATVPRQKTAMRDDKHAEMHGDPNKIKEAKAAVKNITGFAGLATGCCCCLPMHYNKQRPFDDARQATAQ